MAQRIAIIEDEESILSLYRMKFENDGFHVITATNGKDGLQLIEEHEPHVVIMDIMMPEMDGFEMLKKAHSKNLTPTTLILTNLPYDDVKAKARSYHVADIFVKVETTPVIVCDRVKELLEF